MNEYRNITKQYILAFPVNPFLSGQVDSLIEAFGSHKQKRALTSRRLNQVGSETLQHAVAKAAQNVIDQKGLEGECRPISTLPPHYWTNVANC